MARNPFCLVVCNQWYTTGISAEPILFGLYIHNVGGVISMLADDRKIGIVINGEEDRLNLLNE